MVTSSVGIVSTFSVGILSTISVGDGDDDNDVSAVLFNVYFFQLETDLKSILQ